MITEIYKESVREYLNNLKGNDRNFVFHDEIDHIFHAEIKSVKLGNNDERIIEGWASTDDIDRISDVVLAKAFRKTLKDYLKNPVMTYMHNLGMPIGIILDAKVVDGKNEPIRGLFVKAQVDSTEQIIWRKIQEKTIRAFSFGFKILAWHEETKNIDGAEVKIRIIDELELIEIAVVSVPMNKEALFTAVKAFEGNRTTDIICEGGCKECGKCLENYKKYLIETIENEKGKASDFGQTLRCPADELDFDELMFDSIKTAINSDDFKSLSTYLTSDNESESLEYFRGHNFDVDMTIKEIMGEYKKILKNYNESKIWEEKETEFWFRIKDPDKFKEGSFRRMLLKKDSPKVFAVIGRLKGETTTSLQSLRFPKKEGWKLGSAKTWVKDHPDLLKILEEVDAKNIHILSFMTSDEVIIDQHKDDELNVWKYTVIENDGFEPGTEIKIFSVTENAASGLDISLTADIYQEEKAGRVISSRNKKRLSDAMGKVQQSVESLNSGLNDLKQFLADHEGGEPVGKEEEEEPKGTEPKQVAESDESQGKEDPTDTYETVSIPEELLCKTKTVIVTELSPDTNEMLSILTH